MNVDTIYLNGMFKVANALEGTNDTLLAVTLSDLSTPRTQGTVAHPHPYHLVKYHSYVIRITTRNEPCFVF